MRSTFSCTVALLCLGSLSSALQEIRFKPSRDLPGFAACEESDYKDLFELRRFEKYYREMISPERLAELQAEWAEVKGRVEARIRRIETDATEKTLYELEKGQREHPFLSRIDFTRIDTFAPFYFFIEPPPKDEPGYFKYTADNYGKWFRELGRVFEREYAKDLEQRADYPVFALYVLRSSSAYQEFAQSIESRGLYWTRAHYNPELRFAVTYGDYFGVSGESKADIRRAAMHELVHILQHAHYGEDALLPRSVFFNEGLADYLSFHKGTIPRVLNEHQVDEEALAFIAQVGNLKALQCLLLPLEEMVAIDSYAAAETHLQKRAEAQQLSVPGPIAIAAVYRQASLWMHYLHHGDKGLYRDNVKGYIAGVFSGKPSQEAFEQAFVGVDLEKLDRGFLYYVANSIKTKLRTTTPVPRKIVHAGTPVEAGAAAETDRFDTGSFSPSELAIDSADPEMGYVLALAQAGNGRFRAAARTLKTVLEEADGALLKRAKVESARIERYLEERQRFFEYLQTKGVKLNLKRSALGLLAHIKEVKEAELVFEDNLAEINRLAREELPAVDLADAMRKKKGFAWDPIHAYPYVLTDNESWERSLPGDDEAAESLREDARSGFGGYRQRARAAALLDQLSNLPLPFEKPDLEAGWASLEELTRDHMQVGFVAERRPALQRMAAEILKVEFEGGGLVSALAGKCEALGAGRYRLRYDFDSEAELEDFPRRQYLNSRAGNTPEGKFSIDRKKLSAYGFASLRHALEFEAPLKISFTARYVSRQPNQVDFLVGFNDNGRGHYAGIKITGGLEVFDPAIQNYSGGESFLLNERYQIEMRYDGDTALGYVNGDQVARMKLGPRKAGGIFIFSATPMSLELDEFVIEGTISEDGMLGMRNDWIEKRLESIGLGG